MRIILGFNCGDLIDELSTYHTQYYPLEIPIDGCDIISVRCDEVSNEYEWRLFERKNGELKTKRRFVNRQHDEIDITGDEIGLDVLLT